MDLGPGTMIGGRYRLERLLGRGGMGEVWSAKHMVTRRDVALKFLTVDPHVLPQMRRRFVREARAAAAVNHPNVIAIHDVFELQDETPVMVMDLLTGEGLGDRLGRVRALSVEDTAAVMAPVISAVGTAHALGIVHRDLKPENIFLARQHDGEVQVKVLDFGIAKLGSSMELGQTGAITGTGAVLGTPYYMALEQAYGEKDIDHRADIWSLGVILYECLAGKRPIEGDNFGQIVKRLTHGTIEPLTQIAPHVPEDLAQLVSRMLQRAREERPQDLREVLVVLRRYTGATTRTFGGAQPPQAPVESVDGDPPESLRADPNPTLVVEDSSDGDSRGNITTKPVVPPPTPSRPGKPVQVRVITGGKAAPADVTLADSAAAVPAPPPPPSRPSHRTALVVLASAALGVAISATAVFAMRRPVAVDPPPGSARPGTVAVESAATVQAAKPQPVETAQTPQTTARPEPALPETAQPASPTTSATASRLIKPLSSASARPVASATVTARPEPAAPPTPTATTTATATKAHGGLVDDPPF